MRLSICITAVILSYFTATAQHTLPAQSNVIITDEEFDDNSRNWSLVNHENIVFTKIENGQFIMDATKYAKFWAIHYNIEDWFQQKPDGMELKVKIIAAANSMIGIMWNAEKNKAGGFNEYSFLINQNGAFSIQQKVDEDMIIIKDWTACPDIKPQDYNMLRITQDTKGKHRFYINGHEVFNVSLPATNFYNIGYYCNKNTALSIDYLKFTVSTSTDNSQQLPEPKALSFMYPGRANSTLLTTANLDIKFSSMKRGVADYMVYGVSSQGIDFSVLYNKFTPDEINTIKKSTKDAVSILKQQNGQIPRIPFNSPLIAMSFFSRSVDQGLIKYESNEQHWGNYTADFMFRQYDIVKDDRGNTINQKTMFGYCVIDEDLWVSIRLRKDHCTTADAAVMHQILDNFRKKK
ncbi:MAG TPA: hypothetical protein VM802_20315 [Chitinophaga sp.]|uniref:hypothetical protein n=1 Tax=Chitinophaga sp. TaxID=1869181 RepID=UPI002BDFD6E7|nr:hypothetical protein [Chitinophaga sp.]HVI47234.1 hypothetical protein [Chitinophaga sp.]